VIVLDTHIWIWWVSGEPTKLTPSVIDRIENAADVGVSVMSCLEVARLQAGGRLDLQMDVRLWLNQALAGADIQCLPVTPAIAVLSTELAPHHKDPVDRLIIATAIANEAELISFDQAFSGYAELQGRLVQ
jgi:PIN domain nuclease of toxin-antitoxin system